MPFVVDASIAAAWCLPDEFSVDADVALDRIACDSGLVPDLFWHELRHVLLAAERRGRIMMDHVSESLFWLRALPIGVYIADDDRAVLALARRHKLTAYDAVYLTLALSLQCPLATLDGALMRAAQVVGVELVNAGA